MTDHAASTVVLVDPRLGAVLPAAAITALRSATAVHVTAEVTADLPGFAEHGEPAPDPEQLLAAPAGLVLITTDGHGPHATALQSAGARTVTSEPVLGAEVLAAAAVMHRLRSPGGCPWDAEQTHDSLRQYLVEETYEVLEAIETRDRPALREELGDVLLQVLFHAAIATEDTADPFTVDEVAGDLVRKLVGRHPHVFGDTDSEVSDAASQQLRWDRLKRVEKQRESSVDGVPFNLPSLLLAGKLARRATRAGLPADLLPADPLFSLAARTALTSAEPEMSVRDVARRFVDQVRVAERAARDAGIDPATMDADTWRKFWPDR